MNTAQARRVTAQEIDDLLPQTQCGLCTYSGCWPYAQAIAEKNAPLNLCLPGNVETLIALAQACDEDPTPFIPNMQQNAQPILTAIIREEACIGCRKCIQACPTDAIIGAAKLMHTVITSACTGCELCLPVCPVDCITMNPIEILNETEKKERSQHWRQRYLSKKARVSQQRITQQTVTAEKSLQESQMTLNARRDVINAAVERARKKKDLT